MEVYKVKHVKELNGTVEVSKAKNAVLPILFATLLTEEPVTIKNVPMLTDVQCALDIIRDLGGEVSINNNDVTIQNLKISSSIKDYSGIQKMRASILSAGPLLARVGKIDIIQPGGCSIGVRPIDLHLKGFKELGAKVKLEHGSIKASAGHLTGSEIYLDFPSVGATENIMLAATLAKGETIIRNAAQEPEIVDLANFLISMGASIKGAGEENIVINGVSRLHGTTYTPIADRIEAGSYLTACAICGGEITVTGVIPEHLKAVSIKLMECGADITEFADTIKIRSKGSIKSTDIRSMPYPGFPSDMQSQFSALMTVASGNSVIVDTVFEGRNKHVPELMRMGANIRQEDRTTIITGVKALDGTIVTVPDLRAGAALIIAAMRANGISYVEDAGHIRRGYYMLPEKLNALGASIQVEFKT